MNLPITTDMTQIIDEQMDWHKRGELIPKMLLLGSMAYFAAGKLLTDGKMCRDWEKDNSGATDFWAWAEYITGGYKRTTIQRMVDCSLVFENQDRALVLSVDNSKLALVANICKDMDEKEKEDWLHKAKVNSCKHLELNIREHKGEDVAKQEMCLCAGAITLIERCRKCGKVLSITHSDDGIKP
jgi:hypothetical protein